jgi:hypothetical protein
MVFVVPKIESGSQSDDRELQRQRCKAYKAVSSLVRFRNIVSLKTL